MAAVRELFAFECTGCKRKGYTSSKNKRQSTEKISLKKFCRHCRSHVLHKESKIR